MQYLQKIGQLLSEKINHLWSQRKISGDVWVENQLTVKIEQQTARGDKVPYENKQKARKRSLICRGWEPSRKHKINR